MMAARRSLTWWEKVCFMAHTSAAPGRLHSLKPHNWTLAHCNLTTIDKGFSMGEVRLPWGAPKSCREGLHEVKWFAIANNLLWMSFLKSCKNRRFSNTFYQLLGGELAVLPYSLRQAHIHPILKSLLQVRGAHTILAALSLSLQCSGRLWSTF